MYLPEIIFAPEKGKIYDFFAILNISTKTSDICTIYEELGVKPDDEIISSYTRIYTAIKHKNNDLIKLLFSSGENGISFFSSFNNLLLDANNIEDVINKIINFDNELFPVKILSFLDNNHNLNEKFYMKLLSDREQLFSYIDSLNLSDKNKWIFMRFIDEPKNMLDELYSTLVIIKNELDMEYKLLKNYREAYYTILKQKIDNSIDNETIDQILPINRQNYQGVYFEKVNVSVTTYLPYTFQYIWNNRILNLYLGFYYDKQINKNVNDEEDIAFIFKALSDETRNRIIRLVNKESNIGFGDIGKELDMPLSSLSHHMDIIVEAGIINRINEGKKTFFIINNEGLDNAIRILTSIKI